MSPQQLIACLCVLLVGVSHGSDAPRIHNDCSALFADRETAGQNLIQRDQFVEAMSRFDRQSRLQSDEDVTIDDYLKFVSQHILEWTDKDITAIKAVLNSIEQKCRLYTLPLPQQILFVKTDGKEEGGAAYCRGNVVVLPAGRLAVSQERLERLVLHELFHVLSSHNPDLRQQLYSIIGFEMCENIPLPPSLADRKLTNPDAPLVNCVIRLTHNDEELTVAPILFANVDNYESKLGGPFFRFLEFKLMVVARDEAKWKPIEVDGAPALLDPNNVPAYFKHIGRNTKYIIHPDEILADNFVHLVFNSEDLESPEIIEQMRHVLTRDVGN